jgi:hypothetical protein
MKKIVEYKMNISENGGVYHPSFITDPGWWWKQSDKTYIGMVLPDNERSYYVPDTLTELTKAELIQRVKDIHADVPYVQLDGVTRLTETEIEEWLETWHVDHVE